MQAFNSFWCMFDDGKEDDIQPVGSEEAYSFPECDYEKNRTNLYRQIENRNWTAVNHFLLTGYWTGSFFADSIPPAQQVCTWVTKYDPNVGRRKKVLWTHLPIHAALSYGAPEGVVQLLIRMAPPTLRCADDQRMLPLHLAFRRGASDQTIATIMEHFPEACAVRDFRGRTPAECAEEGPNSKRGTIINTVLKYNQKAWEKKAAKKQNDELDTVKRTLMQRNERIENLQTAFDLVRVREDQTREYFKLVMTELGKMKEWHDEKAPEELVNNGGTLSAIFVKELTDRFDALFATAETLNHQHKKAKNDSDRTLKALKAVWDVNGWDDLKVRTFDTGTESYDQDTKRSETKDSEISSVTSLNTSSTTGKKETEKMRMMAVVRTEVEPKASLVSSEEDNEEQEEAEPEEKMEQSEEEPQEEEHQEEGRTGEIEQAEEEELAGPVEEPALADVEVSVQGTPSVVPEVVALPEPEKKSSSSSDEEEEEGDDTDIRNTISEMTSLDMSEAQASGASSKKNMFRMGLAKITRQSSKRSSSKNSLAGKSTKSTPLPKPKGHKKKPIQLPTSLLKKGPGSIKISPTH